jgi:hypothetical protein
MVPLMDFLTSQKMYDRGVRVVGPETLELRAPTISFIVIDTHNNKGMRSQDIIEHVDQKGTVSLSPKYYSAFNARFII